MNTLQVYKLLSDGAGELNRLAVQLREGEITKKAAEAEARTKTETLLEKLK